MTITEEQLDLLLTSMELQEKELQLKDELKSGKTNLFDRVSQIFG